MGSVLAGYKPFDAEAIVTISYVDPPKRGWYMVSDSLQRVFATKNQLVASLADQYRVRGLACRPVTVPGFPNRELIGLSRADEGDS